MATLDAFADAKEYRFNKIVLVHSASAAYIELPVDVSLAILGGNNNGKTSLLHVFLLFLLPEVNFKECSSKFGFQSNGNEHSGIDSFNYYFPSPDSYIILEAVNPKHTFCVVLHQSREQLGYGRIAVPKPYADIEHLFWDKRSPVNNGAGAPRFDIGFTDIQKALLDFGGSKQTQRTQLKEQLYNRVQVGRSDTQYCLVPLGNASDSSIAALKTLLQLSAGLLPKGNGLAKAVASVISSSMSSSRDKSEIDFEKIQEERAELRGKQDHIQRLKNNKCTWDALTEQRRQYASLKTQVTKDLCSLYQKALDQQTYHSEVVTENVEQLQDIGNEIEMLREQKKLLADQLKKVEISLGVASEAVSNSQKKVDRALNAIRSNMPVVQSSDHHDIINYLTECKREYEQRLDALRDIDSAQTRLKANIARQNKVHKEIENLDTLLSSDRGLLDELDSQTGSLIYSVNSSFSHVRALDDPSVIDACRHFASSLGQDGKQLTIGGVAIPNVLFTEHSAETIRSEQKMRKQSLVSESVELDLKISKDNKFLQGSEIEQADERKELKKQIDEITAEIASIFGLNENEENLEVSSEKVELETQRKNDLAAQIMGLNEKISTQKNLHSNTKQKAEISRQANSQLKNSLATLERNCHQLINGAFEHTAVPAPATVKDAEAIDEESKSQDKIISVDLASGRNHCIRLLQELVKTEIVSGIEDAAYTVDLSSANFEQACNRLHTEFHNLDMYEQELSDRIKTHNANTSREISLLEQINGGIGAFTNEINQSFSGVQVSNLESVELRIQKHQGFTTLIDDVSHFRTDMDSLASDSFYERLRNFSDTYLQKGRKKGLLDIESIVTGVEYIYGFKGRQEKTQQSNGTTIMVNTVVLSILLDKLTSGDLKMRMPVIFDEAAAIDENNLPALHDIVQRVGLTLLAATPHFQMHISKTLGEWCYLFDQKVTDTEQVGAKCTTIYHSNGEYLRRIEGDSQPQKSSEDPLMAESETE
ncbi:coiled-coil domain-containing protein [Endozoicomonas numazuensis]|uniref:Uncharacterized protein n=1 Tax=Endozoicomonas numazuensis TaxID=1137799 RepID=A0A081NLT8_9GAMM|nr:hypothetical protein [Endozoicomonas numazuensis]KEQ19411.1 hypothetical protein GZ78_05515 [Endozoicomonas numazuensis]